MSVCVFCLLLLFVYTITTHINIEALEMDVFCFIPFVSIYFKATVKGFKKTIMASSSSLRSRSSSLDVRSRTTRGRRQKSEISDTILPFLHEVNVIFFSFSNKRRRRRRAKEGHTHVVHGLLFLHSSLIE